MKYCQCSSWEWITFVTLSPSKITTSLASVDSKKLGGFPKDKASIIAAHISASKLLEELHGRVINSVKDASISYDDKHFKPHITLGRIKRKQVIENDMRLSLLIPVNRIQLLKSELTAKGPIYSSMADIEIWSKKMAII